MKSLKKNYIYNLIYQLFTIITPFITTPYVSRVLGAAGIGEYSYGLSIATYFGIFGTLGVTTYAQIEIAKNKENIERQKKLAAELFISKTITMIICCLLYVLLIVTTKTHQEMLIILIIYLLSQMNDISWILQGLEQFEALVIRNMIIKIISIMMIFIFVRKNTDLYLYTIIMQGTVLFGNFLLWPYVWDYIRPKRLIEAFNAKSILSNLKKSMVYFIPTVATTVYTVLDKSMIGWITHSDLQNGFYEQAHKIEQIIVVLITSLGTVTLPRMTFLNSKNDRKEMNRIMQMTILMVLFLSIPMCFGLIGISKNLIPIFLGDEYVECINLVKIFSLLIVIIGLDNIIGRQCLMATGNQKKYNIGVIAGAIVNVIINILLIPILKSSGAAIASVAAELVILIIFCYFGKEYLKINILSSFIKYLIASICMYIVTVLFQNFSESLIISMFTQIIFGGITYFIVLLLLKEKFLMDLINTYLNKILKKIKVKV